MNHTCPAPGCTVAVPNAMLMCRRHWYQLPKPIRDAVWQSWHDRVRNPVAHRDAIAAAVQYSRAVNVKAG